MANYYCMCKIYHWYYPSSTAGWPSSLINLLDTRAHEAAALFPLFGLTICPWNSLIFTRVFNLRGLVAVPRAWRVKKKCPLQLRLWFRHKFVASGNLFLCIDWHKTIPTKKGFVAVVMVTVYCLLWQGEKITRWSYILITI